MSKPKPLNERQQRERIAILRDVRRDGCKTFWGRLHGLGHHFMTVKACVARGDLTEPSPYDYVLTDMGCEALRAAGDALAMPIRKEPHITRDDIVAEGLRLWREREMKLPARVRRMIPDEIDDLTGAWDRVYREAERRLNGLPPLPI